MSRYEIVPCRLTHLRILSRTMRAEDRAEFELAGMVVRHRLHRLHRMTWAPRSAIVDGEVAAAWGDAAGLMDIEGLMWLVTSRAVERVPLAFFREARNEIARYLEDRETLRSCIAGPYLRAVRFFGMLGFEVAEPQIIDGAEYRTIRIARHG